MTHELLSLGGAALVEVDETSVLAVGTSLL